MYKDSCWMPCVIVRKEGVMVTVLKALMEMTWKILDIFAIILLVSIFRKKFIWSYVKI